nr:MAG TPA: hypothetical protein [Caudoviricetes sp.]
MGAPADRPDPPLVGVAGPGLRARGGMVRLPAVVVPVWVRVSPRPGVG